MGQPKAPKESRGDAAYQAMPSADTDTVSLHTTPDDYEYDDVPVLPSYSDSEAAASQSQQESERWAAPRAQDEDRYAVIPSTESKRANGSETTIRMNEGLDDPQELYAYITDYLRILPPNPQVRIYGSHQKTTRRNNKNETEHVIDFDFTLSLQKYLGRATPNDEDDWWQPNTVGNGDKAHRGGFWATKAKGYKQDIELGGAPELDLKQWCESYCSSKSKLKIFRVSRNVMGLNTEALKPQLERLVRSTHYLGHIQITFPVGDKNVDIYNPHIVNRWRISWVRYIFYFTLLWLFTWPLLFFLTARWSVYHVDWYFSRQKATSDGQKTYWATITEQDWLEKHRNLLASLVVDGYRGDASQFPLDVEPRARHAAFGRVQTGNSNLDSAIRVVQGGLNAWSTIRGRDGDGWGADEN
ncbi:Hypothetical protein R9X50_00451900 [Acrodontium crateriforme]|uniref:Uncharacterized protein n=1 Tax=Acrodontium crateriforme TaxID=150365 RepID=A0AAQ3M5L6_9PEZI|nr:Hypothetical protein R9X50_00451900 [Acrodontium crateriforme]